MKKKKEVWLSEELLPKVRKTAKSLGLKDSQFIENCIMKNLHIKPIKKTKKLTPNEEELLKVFNKHCEAAFYISQLEVFCLNGKIDAKARCVRDVIKSLCGQKYIELTYPDHMENNKVKYYKITRKGMNLCKKFK